LPLEPELENAVHQVVAENGQPEAVAKRMIAWLEEMSKTDIGKEDQNIFFDDVKEALVVKSESENAD